MRKYLLLLLLLGTCGPAAAEMTLVADMKNNITIFVDPATAVVIDGKVRIWRVFELKIPDEFRGKPLKSLKGEDEIDCKTNTYRNLSSAMTTGERGSGESFEVRPHPTNWEQTSSRSEIEILRTAICHK
jgi:hypothetical protein